MLETIARRLPDDLQPRCLKWLAFIANNVDFWPFAGHIHQQSHWSRTLALALLIGHAEGFSDADLDCLAATASFHDCRRLDEFLDTGHGLRAADCYASFCSDRGMPFDPRAWLAMAWHDRDDELGLRAIRAWEAGAGPAEFRPDGDAATDYVAPDWPAFSTQGWHVGAETVYRAFKDADALDRIRMGTWALDPSYLRLDSSKGLMSFAEGLALANMGPGAAELDGSGAPTLRPHPSQQAAVDGTQVAWDVAVSAAAPRPERRDYLVVVDVQNDFVDGALGTPEAVAALPAMVGRVRGFEGQVVFTKDTHDAWYLSSQEGSRLPVPHCLVGTRGWQLAGDLERMQAESGAPVFIKGAFGSPELAADLAAAYARGALGSVELIGLCTDICVVSNALLIKAALPEVPVRVAASCCAGTTPAAHEAALAAMASCQIDIV